MKDLFFRGRLFENMERASLLYVDAGQTFNSGRKKQNHSFSGFYASKFKSIFYFTKIFTYFLHYTRIKCCLL